MNTESIDIIDDTNQTEPKGNSAGAVIGDNKFSADIPESCVCTDGIIIGSYPAQSTLS